MRLQKPKTQSSSGRRNDMEANNAKSATECIIIIIGCSCIKCRSLVCGAIPYNLQVVSRLHLHANLQRIAFCFVVCFVIFALIMIGGRGLHSGATLYSFGKTLYRCGKTLYKTKWIAERLEMLPAKQVAWVRFPVSARPTFSVEKWLFSVTLCQGARSRALQLRL
jgi:hypothetical protein